MFSVCMKHFFTLQTVGIDISAQEGQVFMLNLLEKLKAIKGLLSTSTSIETQEHPENVSYAGTASTICFGSCLPSESFYISELQYHKS